MKTATTKSKAAALAKKLAKLHEELTALRSAEGLTANEDRLLLDVSRQIDDSVDTLAKYIG